MPYRRLIEIISKEDHMNFPTKQTTDLTLTLVAF